MLLLLLLLFHNLSYSRYLRPNSCLFAASKWRRELDVHAGLVHRLKRTPLQRPPRSQTSFPRSMGERSKIERRNSRGKRSIERWRNSRGKRTIERRRRTIERWRNSRGKRTIERQRNSRGKRTIKEEGTQEERERSKEEGTQEEIKRFKDELKRSGDVWAQLNSVRRKWPDSGQRGQTDSKMGRMLQNRLKIRV